MKESVADDFILDLDHKSLRSIGRTTGFPAKLRPKIWTILLVGQHKDEEDNNEPHKDEKQVLLDTNRSFISCLPPGIDVKRAKDDLQHVICQVLRRNPWLNYYQGYHDIAQIILIVMGRTRSVEVLEALSYRFLRDFMLSTLQPSMSMLQLVHQIIFVADPAYASSLSQIEPYYAVSTLLTWWVHSLEDLDVACRLFDFLICSDPAMILYTIAASTLLRKDAVKQCDGDPDIIFHTLSTNLKGLDSSEVIKLATDLYDGVKPRQLRYWRRISKYSCLKTKEHTKEAVESLFEKQELDLKKPPVQERHDTYKLLAFGIGAIAIGLAIYYRS